MHWQNARRECGDEVVVPNVTKMATRITSVGTEPNHATRVEDGIGGARVSAAELEEAFRCAVDIANSVPWTFRGIGGYRLLWCRPSGPEATEMSMRDLPDLPASFAVVGRHARCDTHLAGDREIALRHLLVRPGRLLDGTLAVRFIDLRAAMPFYLPDETAQRSISATGPVALRLGRYALIALPIIDDAVAATKLVAPEVREDLRPPDSIVSAKECFSSITILPRVTGVLDIARTPSPGDATLTIMRDGASASVGIERADLDRGVIIGRLPRCLDGGIRQVLSAQISRAHLLLLAEGPRVTAFDLASTNGTYMRKRHVGCATLENGGTTLELSANQGVVFRFTRQPLTS
jgi:hypothetical protein